MGSASHSTLSQSVSQSVSQWANEPAASSSGGTSSRTTRATNLLLHLFVRYSQCSGAAGPRKTHSGIPSLLCFYNSAGFRENNIARLRDHALLLRGPAELAPILLLVPVRVEVSAVSPWKKEAVANGRHPFLFAALERDPLEGAPARAEVPRASEGDGRRCGLHGGLGLHVPRNGTDILS